MATENKCKVGEHSPPLNKKVTIVGTGHVGISCAFSILTQNVSSEICLIDQNENKAAGERMDLQHGSIFLRDPKITSSSDYAASAGSRLCIVTAGVRQEKGESRLSLVNRNADVLKKVIPELVRHSPESILLIVTNPVDVMTYVAWRLSGLPKSQVFGSGTYLDSARFQFFISQRLNVPASSCHGWIIGEHGDSSVPIWSEVSVAGVALHGVYPSVGDLVGEERVRSEVHQEVVNAAYNVIKMKGYTSWAIALCVSSLTSAILQNNDLVVPVSTSAKTLHGIDKDVFLSLPCVINAGGVTSIVELNLTASEKEQLKKSADLLAKLQEEIRP